MPPGARTCSRLAFKPSVNTGGCSSSQISSGVDGSRASVNFCIARQVGSYSTSPKCLTNGAASTSSPRIGRRGRELAVVEAGVVAGKRLFRAIARSDQRARDAFQKPQGQRPLAIAVEFIRRHEALDVQMIGCRPQILTQREN